VTRPDETEGHSQSGFTLAEMLVALALLGLMSAFALTSLNTLGAVKRVEARIDGRSDVEAVQRHLQQAIADTRVVFDSDDQAQQKINFSGTPVSLKIVTVLDDRFERGGLYRLDYSLAASDLKLDYAVYRPSKSAQASKTEILLQNVASLSFRYFGPAELGGIPQWQQSWPVVDQLPLAIEVTVGFPPGDTRKWQPLIIPLASSSSSS
jgi:type II secretion system protein J